jgi:hypothetical protein
MPKARSFSRQITIERPSCDVVADSPTIEGIPVAAAILSILPIWIP